MRTQRHEDASVTLEQVMRALGDPVRLSVVRQLLDAHGKEKACGTFQYTVSKATFSHHLKILREAGIIRTRQDGTRKMTSLCGDNLERRFPGLIGLISRRR
jgi:DNA-binding transcriptional ArsR family regulator